MAETDNKWTAQEDDDGDLLWWASSDPLAPSWGLTSDDLALDDVGFGDYAAPAFAALVQAVRDAALLAEVRELLRRGHIGPDGPDADDSIVLSRIAALLGEN